MDLVSCRKAFSQRLTELAEGDGRIYVVATDSRGSVTIGGFAERFPGRFIECGIAEQGAAGIAAGLAKTGATVFLTGPACFLSARSYEQVKVDIAYNNTNVKIVGVSAGVSYGPLGGTHTTLHDLAGMRSLANMAVYAPADDVQTRWLTEHLAANTGPAYVRMGRGDVERVYPPGETFEAGKAKTLREGGDITLIACGEAVTQALRAAELLAGQGIFARVMDMFTIKPLDAEAVMRAARETHAILTVEEHSVHGGLGEAVAHVVCETVPVKMKILGFPDEEIRIGSPAELFDHYGLTGGRIADAAAKLLENPDRQQYDWPKEGTQPGCLRLR